MRTVLSIIAVILAFIGYAPYFRDIFRGKTRPHAFTWLVWALLTTIAFFAQLSGGGGAGSWVTGATAVISAAVTALAFRRGRQDIVPVDWLFLAGCLLALGLWALTKGPLVSVVLVTLIDALAFVPTFRKSYVNPESETTVTYVFSALKFAIAIAALDVKSLTTVLYPASLVLTNGLFVAMVLWRRARLRGPL